MISPCTVTSNRHQVEYVDGAVVTWKSTCRLHVLCTAYTCSKYLWDKPTPAIWNLSFGTFYESFYCFFLYAAVKAIWQGLSLWMAEISSQIHSRNGLRTDPFPFPFSTSATKMRVTTIFEHEFVTNRALVPMQNTNDTISAQTHSLVSSLQRESQWIQRNIVPIKCTAV